MTKLNVSIEKNGILVPVGTISGSDRTDARFCYSADYLSAAGTPISISLPVQEAPFSPEQTACYFEGLLPEGFTRRTVAQWMHVDEANYLSILHGLGRECLGAICISEADETVAASYEEINASQIRALAAEGVAKSSELVTQSHLSLTGASGKVGLYYDAPSQTWYLPRGTAPSTHIIKQSHVRLEALVSNEMLSLMTAKRCQLETPASFIVNTGYGKDSEVLFATQRYDRLFEDNNPAIDFLPRPYRLHQEDFAQALGIPSSEKYEKAPRGYMKAMFDILRHYSADPVTDQLKLWDIIVFDYLIGNTDAHIKNFSLLYGKDLRSIRLAPAYDLISTTIYESSTREMSFYVGNALLIDEITESSFREAAAEIHIGERFAVRRYNYICNHFREALREAAAELRGAGFSKAEEIEERILHTGGYAKLQ